VFWQIFENIWVAVTSPPVFWVGGYIHPLFLGRGDILGRFRNLNSILDIWGYPFRWEFPQNRKYVVFGVDAEKSPKFFCHSKKSRIFSFRPKKSGIVLIETEFNQNRRDTGDSERFSAILTLKPLLCAIPVTHFHQKFTPRNAKFWPFFAEETPPEQNFWGITP